MAESPVQIKDEKKVARNYSPHLNPVHVATAPSLLSRISPKLALSTSEARNQRRQLEGRHVTMPLDFSGFKHLLMLILVIGNIKVFWVDWNYFGFWNTLSHFGLGCHDLEMAITIFMFNLLLLPLSLGAERLAALTLRQSGNSLNKVILAFAYCSHVIICITCLVAGSYLTWTLVDHPLISTGCEANVIVTFLKLVSFGLTNYELRNAKANKTPFPEFYATGPQYPLNLSLANFVYFWGIPTLVYQPVYPKRPVVRWGRVFPLFGEVIAGMILTWVLMMQMAFPVLEHLVDNWGHNWKMVVEDYFTLTTISITIWLAGFVALFQSMLNLVAEVTRFADRDFYGDWWNAGSVGTFWRDWNRPISNYFRRHIYVPLRTMGVSRNLASNAVFFVSALLHELLFGVATHNFNGVAFGCMMVQPLLIVLTAPLEKKRGAGTTVGNCVFWVSILFGQPVATVIYFLQWVSKNPTSKTPTSWWASKFYSI